MVQRQGTENALIFIVGGVAKLTLEDGIALQQNWRPSFLWVSSAPLDTPVVPPVYCKTAVSDRLSCGRWYLLALTLPKSFVKANMTRDFPRWNLFTHFTQH